MPAIADTVQWAGLQVHDLATVVCGAWLGTVSSMALMVGGHDGVPDGRYLASVDALRGEQYAAVVVVGAGCVRDVGQLMLMRADELEPRAREMEATTIGPGCEIEAWPTARGIVRAAHVIRSVEVASWEPEYGRLPAAETKRAAV